MVKRHKFIHAIRYPDPATVYQPSLRRPLTLKDVLARHPEWKRRLVITLQAKRAGNPVPEFPPLQECFRCGSEFLVDPRRPRQQLCPKCRPLWKRVEQ